MNSFDVIIIGAGAAGLMCAIEASLRGRKVLVLEKSNKPGKKILMSGGGRCNFTNLYTSFEQYESHNPHFFKSALSRYTQWDFIAKVNAHRIDYYEKTLGQLFCANRSKDILEMLLRECESNGVTIQLQQAVDSVSRSQGGFCLKVNNASVACQSLVVATGGLSIPTLGSSPFGYQLAEQFGLNVYPLRAGLVPFTWHTDDKKRFATLAGISVEAHVSCRQKSFRENILFTHRGLSGPAILQISSYWRPGDTIKITLLPDCNLSQQLLDKRLNSPDMLLKNALSQWLPKRLVEVFYQEDLLNKPLKQLELSQLQAMVEAAQNWQIKPNGTEGYRTAEVTLGGVDCMEISSKSFEAYKVSGFYFIGEVLDVAGWLGGYNFQWAWSSGWAAGQVV